MRRRPAIATTWTTPQFVEPMLAMTRDAPFDDPAWSYELKWDGFRAICQVSEQGHRLTGRRRTDFTARFPQLACLAKLAPGVVLDGEIVAMREGKPDFAALLRRSKGVNQADASIVFVAFDLLYDATPWLDRPCVERRERLRVLIERLNDARVVFSRPVDGEHGVAYYGQVVATGLEGVVAKRKDSRYRPGVRSDDWVKIKPRREAVCVVVGYETSPAQGLRSLVIAAEVDGELRCVGRVGSGIGPVDIAKLLPKLVASRRPTPVVACPGVKAVWVEPKWLCRVSYAERTATGQLRQSVFEGWIDPPAKPTIR